MSCIAIRLSGKVKRETDGPSGICELAEGMMTAIITKFSVGFTTLTCFLRDISGSHAAKPHRSRKMLGNILLKKH